MTKKQNKYTYYRIIQTNGGYGWDDDDFHEADSSGFPLDFKAFKENLKAYHANFNGGIRCINRKELNHAKQQIIRSSSFTGTQGKAMGSQARR